MNFHQNWIFLYLRRLLNVIVDLIMVVKEIKGFFFDFHQTTTTPSWQWANDADSSCPWGHHGWGYPLSIFPVFYLHLGKVYIGVFPSFQFMNSPESWQLFSFLNKSHRSTFCFMASQKLWFTVLNKRELVLSYHSCCYTIIIQFEFSGTPLHPPLHPPLFDVVEISQTVLSKQQ